MSREAKERILWIGEREIRLKCPICGGEKFFKQEARVNTSLFTELFDKFVYYYVCEDCSHMIWMENDQAERKPAKPLSPVEEWENKLRLWGYANDAMALWKIIGDKKYHEDAHTAARNLLEKLNK